MPQKWQHQLRAHVHALYAVACLDCFKDCGRNLQGQLNRSATLPVRQPGGSAVAYKRQACRCHSHQLLHPVCTMKT
jgi:hypothetical protein